MRNPLISIIIPAFNNERIIKHTLESIINQTYTHWECLVVDDGSSDKTMQVVDGFSKKDSRINFFRRPKHKKKGPSACRNYGLHIAKGDYVLFLDSDDILAETCLVKRLEFIENNLDFDLWIFKTKTFVNGLYDDNRVFNLGLDSYSDEKYLSLFCQGKHPFCVTGPIWNISSLKSINGFDENLQVFEDPDLHIRAFESGLKSKTNAYSESDSFYRLSLEKRQNQEEKSTINKIDKSAYVFFKKHLKSKSLELRKYGLKYYVNNVLQKSSIWMKIRFYKLFSFHSVFNIKAVIFIPLMLVYKVLKIDSVNGLGYYRLNNFVFNKD